MALTDTSCGNLTSMSATCVTVPCGAGGVVLVATKPVVVLVAPMELGMPVVLQALATLEMQTVLVELVELAVLAVLAVCTRRTPRATRSTCPERYAPELGFP